MKLISSDERVSAPIVESDFKFVNHFNPGRFFSGKRPIELIKTSPSIEVFSNVIYTPSSRLSKPFDGCLYDEQMVRIDRSCIIRGRADKNVTHASLRYDKEVNSLPTCERPLLYLGYLNPHYGHFLTESLSRWWALVENLSGIDGYLLDLADTSILDLPHVKACLSALKIDARKIVYFDRPTRIKSIVVPEASIQLGSHIFSMYKELFEELVAGSYRKKIKLTEQPLYVSRRLLPAGVKRFNGEEKIEEFLSNNGAHIMHPQLLTFEEQVRLFNAHTTVVGFIGSGMHNISLSIEPKTVVYFTSDHITESCFLIDKCFSASSTYVQVCAWNDRARGFSDGLLEKLKVSRRSKGIEFGRTYNVNCTKTIDWLKKVGFG